MIGNRFVDKNLSDAMDRFQEYDKHQQKLATIKNDLERRKVKKTELLDLEMLARSNRMLNNRLKSHEFKEHEKIYEIKKQNQKLLDRLMEISQGKQSLYKFSNKSTTRKSNQQQEISPDNINSNMTRNFNNQNSQQHQFQTINYNLYEQQSSSTNGIINKQINSNNQKKLGNQDGSGETLEIASYGPVLSVKKLEEEHKNRQRIKRNLQKSHVLPIEGFIKRRKDILNNALPPVSLRQSRQLENVQSEDLNNNEQVTVHQRQLKTIDNSSAIDNRSTDLTQITRSAHMNNQNTSNINNQQIMGRSQTRNKNNFKTSNLHQTQSFINGFHQQNRTIETSPQARKQNNESLSPLKQNCWLVTTQEKTILLLLVEEQTIKRIKPFQTTISLGLKPSSKKKSNKQIHQTRFQKIKPQIKDAIIQGSSLQKDSQKNVNDDEKSKNDSKQMESVGKSEQNLHSNPNKIEKYNNQNNFVAIIKWLYKVDQSRVQAKSDDKISIKNSSLIRPGLIYSCYISQQQSKMNTKSIYNSLQIDRRNFYFLSLNPLGSHFINFLEDFWSLNYESFNPNTIIQETQIDQHDSLIIPNEVQDISLNSTQDKNNRQQPQVKDIKQNTLKLSNQHKKNDSEIVKSKRSNDLNSQALITNSMSRTQYKNNIDNVMKSLDNSKIGAQKFIDQDSQNTSQQAQNILNDKKSLVYTSQSLQSNQQTQKLNKQVIDDSLSNQNNSQLFKSSKQSEVTQKQEVVANIKHDVNEKNLNITINSKISDQQSEKTKTIVVPKGKGKINSQLTTKNDKKPQISQPKTHIDDGITKISVKSKDSTSLNKTGDLNDISKLEQSPAKGNLSNHAKEKQINNNQDYSNLSQVDNDQLEYLEDNEQNQYILENSKADIIGGGSQLDYYDEYIDENFNNDQEE